MRMALLFILTVFGSTVFAQAEKLNELLNKYTYREFLQWEDNPPQALQANEELVVPDPVSQHTLYVIKWKNIDSILIFDSYNGSVRIVMHGKVIKYQKCQATGVCNYQYLDTMYQEASFADSVYIILSLKTQGRDPAFTNKIRRKFKKVLRQLNNNSVKEYYKPETQTRIARVAYKKKAIIKYPGTYNYKSFSIKAKAVKAAQKVEFRSFNDEMVSFKVMSFVFYFTKDGTNSTIK